MSSGLEARGRRFVQNCKGNAFTTVAFFKVCLSKQSAIGSGDSRTSWKVTMPISTVRDLKIPTVRSAVSLYFIWCFSEQFDHRISSTVFF